MQIYTILLHIQLLEDVMLSAILITITQTVQSGYEHVRAYFLCSICALRVPIILQQIMIIELNHEYRN